MRIERLFPLLFLILAAARLPAPYYGDPHFQIVRYEPDQVVELRGAVGWQITIEFGPDERIETVSIGDALAWQVTPNKRASNLFLKPLIKNAATNMTVLTDRRRYVFSLQTKPRQVDTPWVVRFEYPPEIVEAIEEPLPLPEPTLNFAYMLSGDPALRPSRVWDDGQMTYFEFQEGQSIPAIFAGAPGEDEALVNSITKGRIIVVQQTSARFTLRTGKRRAEVEAGVEKQR